MLAIYMELALLLILAIINDTLNSKIKNKLLLFFVIAGFSTGLATGGLEGLAGSVAGAAIPLVLLFILYALKMLGAGDIKLMCTIGAIGGTGLVLPSMAYSFLAGGIIAAIILIIRKNAGERASYFFNYVKACFLCRSIIPYTDFADKSDGAKFRFSYAIACGTAAAVLLKL